MSEIFLDGRIELHCGDMRQILAQLPENSIDSCVCDPPYHLTSIVKRFGSPNSKPVRVGDVNATNDLKAAHARSAAGFMGKQWDGGEIAFEPETWAHVFRVLKPGGHLLAFGAPKNFGFMQVAIANAGFEIRDVLAWMFGSGFPKSHNVGNGWGSALKPAYEPIIMGRKPLIGTIAENMLEHGTGAINIDGCRVKTNGETFNAPQSNPANRTGVVGIAMQATGDAERNHAAQRASIERTQTLGRWPANILHDGSEEVIEAFPDVSTQRSTVTSKPGAIYGNGAGLPSYTDTYGFDESGSAARFFYAAKADSDDRLGSKHPTVKPLDLMQWLARLVTPRCGLVLDCFAGTGTTGEAAYREGMRAILIEREAEYQEDIRRRMALILAGPDERARETIKEKLKGKPVDAGPLFGGSDEADTGGAGKYTESSRTNDRPDGIEMMKP